MTPGLWESGTPLLRDFRFFLSSTYVYKPILINISMNANIIKTHILHKMKYDLKGIKGHKRSFKNFKIIFFSVIYFCLMPNLFKTFQEFQQYKDALNEV